MVYVRLYRGTGLINALIRWQTRSHYAHAAIQVDDMLYEALPFKGVIRRFLRSDDNKADTFFLDLNGGFLASRVKTFLDEQVGKKYDFLGVLRFLTREKERRHNRYFCSELVYEALMQGGVMPLRCAESWKISPALLALAPVLRLVATSGNRPQSALK